MAAGKPARLLWDGAIFFVVASAFLMGTLFLPCLFLVLARVPSASVPQFIGASLLAVLLGAVLGVWMHEAAHYAALRAFGLRARFARWVAVVPLGVRTDGIVPRRAYLCSLLMPALIGVMLAAPVVAASRMGASLSPVAASLGWVGAFMALGASDDLGRAFVILRRPEWQAFEQCESGGLFRPAGEKEWLAVSSKGIAILVLVSFLGLGISALLS
ncbi:MAG: metalloprotease family protein [Thermoflexus sp.]|jgi:hypothetical protein|nr:metalloprotease family protein [Thermoflexus sp.]MDT7947300.1 metalloprotease family protein [Thermoflexus sp.]